MSFLQAISRAFSITVSIYLVLITIYFLTGFEFFPEIMFSYLGVLSILALAFIEPIFVTVG
ncbi:MAG: hypothetical protein ABIA76_02205 [Candidatus Diapherotrites archaeon]